MNQSKRKHESHQRPDAAASLPPRPASLALPTGRKPFPSPIPLLTIHPFPLSMSLRTHTCDLILRGEGEMSATNKRYCDSNKESCSSATQIPALQMHDPSHSSLERDRPRLGCADECPLTVRDAAKFLGVSTQTVYLWVERKQIPHLRVMGRNIRFLKSDLEPFRASFRQEMENV
jgi:excisionase family DNA binding protein